MPILETGAIIGSLLLPLIFGGKGKREKEREEMLDELMKILGPDYKLWSSRAKEFWPQIEGLFKGEMGTYFGEGGLGEFEWSEGTKPMISGLQERMGGLLKYPRGLSPEERQMVINYTLGGPKRTETARMESKKKVLSRMGLLGTGAELEEMEKIERGTAEQEATIRTGIGIDELDRRYKELMGTTEMSSALLSRLMETEQIPELLSAGRRGEQRSFMNQLMGFFGMTQGAGMQTLQPYLQSLFGQMGQEEGGGLEMLPLLMYFLLGDKKGKTAPGTTKTPASSYWI